MPVDFLLWNTLYEKNLKNSTMDLRYFCFGRQILRNSTKICISVWRSIRQQFKGLSRGNINTQGFCNFHTFTYVTTTRFTLRRIFISRWAAASLGAPRTGDHCQTTYLQLNLSKDSSFFHQHDRLGRRTGCSLRRWSLAHERCSGRVQIKKNCIVTWAPGPFRIHAW